MIRLDLYLFWKPESELEADEGSDEPDLGEVTAAQLTELADEVSTRLRGAAEIAAKLEADGWSLSVVGPSVFAHHRKVDTVAAARNRLTKLSIDPDHVDIVDEGSEDGDDGEDFDDGDE